jgi:tripartite-type tricarboxylate transporter receptor subunit TctC
VRASPDGYTLLMISTSNAINAALYTNLSFSLLRDIAPVAAIVRMPLAIVVNPSFPATTIQEFISYAKANPGKLNMASAGNASAPHVAGEMFKMMAGVDMLHVPHRGGPAALTAVLGGQMDVYFVATSSSLSNIKAGKLRALAVTTATRWDGLPDVPALSEVIPEYEASVWMGVGAPRDTPAEIVKKLNHEISAGLADPKMVAGFTDLGAIVLGGSPSDFGKLLAAENEKWVKVIKFAGISAK